MKKPLTPGDIKQHRIDRIAHDKRLAVEERLREIMFIEHQFDGKWGGRLHVAGKVVQ